MQKPLPIEVAIPQIRSTLREKRCAVLQAPPGAGKTTRVPLALMEETWLEGRKIVLLEPRRLAARAAAQRMSELLGEPLGKRVGYHIRLDRRIGPQTRIEVLTEGIFTRRIQGDPSLAGVGLVIFDEFHERSLNTDLGLALCLESGEVLRGDLRILIMSATLDGESVSALIGDAPIVSSPGKNWPVETVYNPFSNRGTDLGTVDRACAAAVGKALSEEEGDILVFLPGVAEIRRTEILLQNRMDDGSIDIVPLYGNLSKHQQDRAIHPSLPGRRKIVLATAIAETSLTIEGVRVVVDAGYMRTARFFPGIGMSRLETLPASKASADQRRGRAGRTQSGVCYRLWTKESHRMRRAFTLPEILQADLASVALELAAWGVRNPRDLKWLDPPPEGAFSQAGHLLRELGALDADGRITPHGREMADFGIHPRLANMVLRARKIGLGSQACWLAALLGERDFITFTGRFHDADIRLRLEILSAGENGKLPQVRQVSVHGGVVDRIRKTAGRFVRNLGIRHEKIDACHAGRLLAFAYPDRIAMARKGGQGGFRMASGGGARFLETDPLCAQDFIVPADLDGDPRNSRIYLAAPYHEIDLEKDFGYLFRKKNTVAWDKKTASVIAKEETVYREIVIRENLLRHPDAEDICRELIRAIRKNGLRVLPWNKGLNRWRDRIVFLKCSAGCEDLPDMTDSGLEYTLEIWLQPFLSGISSFALLKKIDLKSALQSLLTWKQRQQIDEQAPSHITVPSGSRIPLDYGSDCGSPVLAVRLQEMFGLTETPRIADGRISVTLHLLSPAGRPVQVTCDLPSFWQNTYPEVKKDLMGRYPKHHWPHDPLAAQPTKRVKPRKRSIG